MPVESYLLTAIPAAFVLVIVVGIVVRWVRAPRGARSRLRHAFGPIASAGETYQQLHTGQQGLQESIIESVQEQEIGGAEQAHGDTTAPTQPGGVRFSGDRR
ncbi:hypothetical protein [Agromyces ramosus]|uniref:Sec-independent protein translocase protein TatA n=1 Tax=Agromyces ramosus TaxID=33879 RepID=A0ABU0R7N6_9MICO|nr:hypothetical protein [Agromyces ramosus]MDQ0893752.1 hypothetical protein [Agromyces ramosus]